MSETSLRKKMEIFVQFGGAYDVNCGLKDYRGGKIFVYEIVHPCDACDEADCDWCSKEYDEFEYTGTYLVSKEYGINYFDQEECARNRIEVSDSLVIGDLGDALQCFRQWVLEAKDYLTKEKS